ncbi:MAG: hypothetical protein H0Z19_11505 [Archaeoglobus sp.]|uniref:hypothetical protein n=1 Tax=Archaeoglobus sp. TaxID=1872626 RepID=UPI001D50BF11|nr:hypothetical protein [Archaeoglobus sp.]MBO8181074.1 hypothetical protein [Archaeoglobus sp.]
MGRAEGQEIRTDTKGEDQQMATSKVQNPFTAIRKNLGLTIRDMAQALNICFLTVSQTEQGLIARPRTYAIALERAGIIDNAEELIKAHLKWLEYNKKAKLEELKRKVSAL